MEYAHCYLSGEIVFSPEANEPGLLQLGSGGSGFRERVSVLARHSRGDDKLFVPGVPEAANLNDALIFAGYFRDVLGGMSFGEAAALRDIEGARRRSLKALG